MIKVILPRLTLPSSVLESVWIVPAFVLSIIIAMTVWFAYEERQHALETEYAILEAHARIADSQLAGLLRHIRQALRQVAAERAGIPRHALPDHAAMTLDQVKQELPEIRSIVILNAAGRAVTSLIPTLQGFDASQREYFTAHRDQIIDSNFHISRPFKSSFGDYSIVFSVAIRDEQNRFLGVVAAGVNYQFFDSVMQQVMASGGDYSVDAIFNPQGDFLYRSPDPEKYVGFNMGKSAQFQNYLNAKQPMVRSIGVSQADGVERLYIHRSIGNSGLGVAIAHPLNNVLAGWWRNLLLRTLIVALAISATLFLVWRVHLRQREIAAMETIKRDAEVARRLVMIQEEERCRLAVELHDRTSPNLSALEINWRLLADATTRRSTEEAAQVLDDAAALLDDTIESIRTISAEFHPPLLDQSDFWITIEGYAQHFKRRTGIAVQAECAQSALRLPPVIETNLFRIVQEALTNCAKHARAKSIHIRQVINGNEVKLIISDDGAGFDPQHPPKSGQGLRTMQHRAEFIGGRFSLESQAGVGTQIAIAFKLSEPDNSEMFRGNPNSRLDVARH
ncbi:MAG: cache domain-containing protein [Rhodocyclaceae bacterium]|nr:cache domain-containing protein [Rhodocyclaceae bacterium]MDZ4213935.1 cache domain-containing protein [Rhodocyclaceae bacterium]